MGMKIDERINAIIERLNDFLARWPGILPIVGLLFVALNFILKIYPGPGSGWFVDSDLLLHLGIIITIIGMLLVRALSRD